MLHNRDPLEHGVIANAILVSPSFREEAAYIESYVYDRSRPDVEPMLTGGLQMIVGGNAGNRQCGYANATINGGEQTKFWNECHDPAIRIVLETETGTLAYAPGQGPIDNLQPGDRPHIRLIPKILSPLERNSLLGKFDDDGFCIDIENKCDNMNCKGMGERPDLKRCPCHKVWYCDPTCQAQHWKIHKKVCPKRRKRTTKTSNS